MKNEYLYSFFFQIDRIALEKKLSLLIMVTTLDTSAAVINANGATTTSLINAVNRAIRLNFINRTNVSKTPPIVIFQKNMLLEFNQPSIAWKVIKNCGQGDYHTFHFSPDYYLDTSDSRGFHSCKVPAQLGQVYEITDNESGEYLDRKGFLTDVSTLEFENNLAEKKVINANIYKNGKLIASYPHLTPGKKAAFAFKPNIWIGVIDQAMEGKEIHTNSIAQVDTEIELEGIASADIVMTLTENHGESNFRFHLENVVTRSSYLQQS